MEHNYAIENHTAERYLFQELSEEERDAYEEHFFSCSACAEEVKIASDFLESAKRVVQNELKAQLYGHVAHRSLWGSWLNWRSMLHPLPAAACLLFVLGCSVGVYQNTVMIPELKNEAAAQLISSNHAEIGLTQGRDGGPAVVSVAKSQDLLVNFAIPQAAFSAGNLNSYRADLETDSGIKKFSFPLSGQQSNNIFSMHFKAGVLAPGKYVVVVREVNSPGTENGVKGEPDRLPFEIVPQK